MKAKLQRLHRFGGRIFAGGRDQREIDVRRRGDRHFRALRWNCARYASTTLGSRHVMQRLVGMIHRRSERRIVATGHDDQHIIGTRLDGALDEASLAQQADVGRRRHHHRRLLDTRHLAQAIGQLHQRHRVAIEIADDLGCPPHVSPFR